MKRFLYYLVSTVIIGVILYGAVLLQTHFLEEAKMSFNMGWVLILSHLFPIVVGVLLRLPKWILDIKEKKHWTFDWVKAVSIGIPALAVISLPYLMYVPFGRGWPFNTLLHLADPFMFITAGIVFGYVLLDSTKKEESGENR